MLFTDEGKDLFTGQLQQVEERLEDVVVSGDNSLDRLSLYLLERGGKRIRPLLVILTASLYPSREEVVIDLAVAVELIHTASLIHDDIIDEASERRGSESINSRWGNREAVLTGDHLFALAFNLLTEHSQYDLLRPMTLAISKMCQGEIGQLNSNGTVDEQKYFSQIRKKTASLLAAACYAGGEVSSMPAEYLYRMREFGLCLGYGYQIVDDLFDLFSTPESIGKPVGSDLQQGLLTLPLIYLLQDRNYGSQTRQLLKNGDSSFPLRGFLQAAVLESGALAAARNRAADYIERAKAMLDPLPPGEAREELLGLADYLLERKH